MLTGNPIERAFELARSGRFRKIEQIRTGLVREGYHFDPHLAGAVIRRQLLSLCAAAVPPCGCVHPSGRDRLCL